MGHGVASDESSGNVLMTDTFAHLMILPPFRRHGEMLASDGEKVGRTNNVPRGKGTNREKATLSFGRGTRSTTLGSIFNSKVLF
jgi:hypothetical protein